MSDPVVSPLSESAVAITDMVELPELPKVIGLCHLERRCSWSSLSEILILPRLSRKV